MSSDLNEKIYIPNFITFSSRKLEQQQLVNNLLKNNPINWITGEKGVGKTAFVEQVLLNRNFKNYSKIRAKGHSKQFALWIHVVEEITKQALIYDEKTVNQLKRQMNSMDREDLEVLLILIPSLKSLIELEVTKSYLETHQYLRLFKIFTHFFQNALICPTILVLDDLHKADQHSLEYLAWILQEGLLNKVNILGIYEDGTLVNTQANVAPVIQLKPFTRVDLQTFLQPFVRGNLLNEGALTSLIWDKTRGNLANIVTLIREWHNDGTIIFQEETSTWKWTIDLISKRDDIETFLQMGTLFDEHMINSPIHFVLSVAALFEQYFTVDLLAQLVKIEKGKVASILIEAQAKNLIKQSDKEGEKRYYFINENVKHHSLNQLAQHKQNQSHFELSFLLEKERQYHQNLTIFDVLYHANKVSFLFETVENKELVAKWNLQAAKEKKQQFRMEEVRTYLHNAISVLPFDLKLFSHTLIFDVYVECAENLQYFGDIKESKKIYNQLIQYSNCNIEKAKFYLPIIQMEADSGNEVEMLNTLGEIARLVGYKLPKNLSISKQLYRWTKIHFKLKYALKSNRFSNLPSVSSNHRILMKALNIVASESYKKTAPEWFKWILLMNEITYEYGIVEESSHSFSGYAFLLNFVLNDYRAAYNWGNFSLTIVEKNTALYKHAKTLLSICNDSWRKYNPKFLDVSIEDISQRQQDKDPWFTKHHLLVKCSLLLQHSYQLHDIQLQLLDESKGLIVSEDDITWKQAAVITNMISNLTGKITSSDPFISTDIKSPKFLTNLSISESRFILEFIYMNDYITGYILGNFQEAWEAINNCYTLINHKEPKIMIDSTRTYYYLLLLKEIYPNLNKAEKKLNIKLAKSKMKVLKKLAKHSPENVAHKYKVAQAIWAILNEDFSTVERDFKEAYQLAMKYGYGHDSAIILENIAKWYIDQNQLIKARIYLRQACEAYNKWGALKKVQCLEQEYVELLSFHQPDALQKAEYLTIVKSAQAISQEIELDKLLHQLLLIMLQHAGAQYGALIFHNENTWEVEVFGTTESLYVNSIPLEEAGHLLPISLINYVISSTEMIVLHDVKNSLFGANNYVKQHDLKSVLCLPILHQNKLLCILYMENNLYNRAFTEEKLSMLKLLSSQIAISITNARLYADIQYLKNNLEKQVEERTESLKKSMQLTNEAITEMSLYAERNRIAQEIHDIVGHTLTSTILQIEAGRRLISKDIEDASLRFKDAQDLVRHSLNEIRNSVHMLKEDQYYDLNHAIRTLIDETKHNTSVEIDAQLDDVSMLPQITKKLLYHALQEGLTNGIKHGNCTSFQFKLIYDNSFIQFELKDNGRSNTPYQMGFGLKMMKERVEQLNGEFSIIPHGLNGFTLSFKIPLFTQGEGVIS